MAESQHRNHRAGAVLLAVPLVQLRPQLVVAGGPATGRAPLRQWLRAGKCAGLLAQHVEIMLQIQHILAAAVTALVTGNQPPGVPDLDVQRMDPRFHPAARAGRDRVEVGLDCNAALLVYNREYNLSQIKTFNRAGQ
jgi:hypothetical protein